MRWPCMGVLGFGMCGALLVGSTLTIREEQIRLVCFDSPCCDSLSVCQSSCRFSCPTNRRPLMPCGPKTGFAVLRMPQLTSIANTLSQETR